LTNKEEKEGITPSAVIKEVKYFPVQQYSEPFPDCAARV